MHKEDTTLADVPTGTTPQAKTYPHQHTSVLFQHEPRQHQPHNVNLLEKTVSGFNQKLALGLTKSVGTMVCAYIFAVLAIIGFPGFNATPTAYVQWVSQTFIQLVMLSVIMVGQSILGRKQELQAEEQYHTTISTYHDSEQIMQHLSAQDAELLRHAKMLELLLEKNGITLPELIAEGTGTSHVANPVAQSQAASPTPVEGEK